MNFKEKIYRATQKIPKGKVAIYKSIAASVGSPRACRGIASALSKNFDPKIPCHRIVRSDGFVGGYNRGGPRQKAKLLRAEGVLAKDGRIDLKKFSILPRH